MAIVQTHIEAKANRVTTGWIARGIVAGNDVLGLPVVDSGS